METKTLFRRGMAALILAAIILGGFSALAVYSGWFDTPSLAEEEVSAVEANEDFYKAAYVSCFVLGIGWEVPAKDVMITCYRHVSTLAENNAHEIMTDPDFDAAWEPVQLGVEYGWSVNEFLKASGVYE